MKVLSDKLKVTSGGLPVKGAYRAVLEAKDDEMPIVVIQQEINGEWRGTPGRWFLSTLLFGFPEDVTNKVSDGASIDYGQQWTVESGMIDALNVAIKIVFGKRQAGEATV